MYTDINKVLSDANNGWLSYQLVINSDNTKRWYCLVANQHYNGELIEVLVPGEKILLDAIPGVVMKSGEVVTDLCSSQGCDYCDGSCAFSKCRHNYPDEEIAEHVYVLR